MSIEKWTPPNLSRPEFATNEQIEAVVKTYVDEMRERGHIQGLANVAHLEVVARIQDVWRVSFARVMDGPPADEMVSMPAVALAELVARARAVVDDAGHGINSRGEVYIVSKFPLEALRDVLP